MGVLLDENGDPKGWASCLLCGLAAMGEDELEAEKDKKKRLEREGRWKAEKMAAAQTAPQPPPAASTTARPPAEDETELHTADLIRPIVISQPQRVQPMPAPPSNLPTVIITSPTIVENEALTNSRPATPSSPPHSRSATPASMVRSTARSTTATETARSRHDSSASSSSTKVFHNSVLCPWCDSKTHTEERCPRLAGIPTSPTQGMARSSGRYYAAANRSTTSLGERR